MTLHCEIHEFEWTAPKAMICPLCRLEGAETQVLKLQADVDAARAAIRAAYEAAHKAHLEIATRLRRIEACENDKAELADLIRMLDS
jgi:hypothetical protein